jgi:ADP-heptose:LPS heptosyltransferase
MMETILKKKSRYKIIYSRIILKSKLLFTNALSFGFIFIFSKLDDKSSEKKKLLCINTEKMGDLVLASDFLFSLGKCSLYDEKLILINESYKDLLDWGKMNYRVIPLNKKKYRYNLLYRIQIIKRIKREGINKIINFTPERGWINDELTLVTKAKEKFAINNNTRYLMTWISNYNSKIYTGFISSSSINQYENLKNFLLKEKIEIMNNYYDSKNREEENYICIAPYSVGTAETWGLEKYSQLIKKLALEIKIILLGDFSEYVTLKRKYGSISNVNISQNYNLSEITCIIKNSKLFIGNDSGLTHIAHNLGVDTIAIIGGGCYGIFFPYKNSLKTTYFYNKLDCFQCNWQCIYEKRYCLENVSLEDVLSKAENILESIN